jgi:predicted nucleic acid-binding Zn ribbon protein
MEGTSLPTYVYEVIGAHGEGGERFEVVEPMSAQPLTSHPETGQPVRRVFVPFEITGKDSKNRADRALSSDSKLEKMGFTKYVKSSTGEYEKVAGKGPDMLSR